jgi:hypothetical protein
MTWTRCLARLALTTGELADLAAIARAAHVPRRELGCDLQDQHGALHLALAQSYSGPFGPFERWVCWGDGVREFVTFRADQMCPQEFPSATWAQDLVPCPLPAGHEGDCNPTLAGPLVTPKEDR